MDCVTGPFWSGASAHAFLADASPYLLGWLLRPRFIGWHFGPRLTLCGFYRRQSVAQVTIDLKDDKATAGDKDAIEKTDGDSRFKRALAH